ncbi:MAG: 1,4-dihydroxy-2-naphthoate polyprenyltransferase [Planctomycetota bacterium]|jgi:1,4-dihydroxy-2-naphthoate octaprenyltransferase|nr:1,4-dihydroxy-2-naphthoate polyprenyltransferase [Planctomycetota bacterium]
MSPWIAAARPKTLPAGVAPVVVGAALASTVSPINWLAVGACLLGSLLIQIGCNFANDAFDALSGADDARRVGPQRAVAAGLISPRGMLAAAGVVLALAFGIGLYLAALGGWPVLMLGLISIVCAIAYTGGPFPLAYHGLGDLFVFAFFGLLATLGTAWIQVAPAGTSEGLLAMPWWWWACAASLGLQASAILTINNIRDLSTDATVGKRTLPVRLGPVPARIYHASLHLLAVAGLLAAWLLTGRAWLLLPGVIASLGGAAVSLAVFRHHGAALNRQLARCAALELVTSLCLVIACSLGP